MGEVENYTSSTLARVWGYGLWSDVDLGLWSQPLDLVGLASGDWGGLGLWGLMISSDGFFKLSQTH